MPRPAQTMEDVVREVVSKSVKKIAAALEQRLALLAAQERAKGRKAKGAKPSRAAARRARPRGKELTRWVADRRARRVPTFVIEMTGGLDTKKKIVAKFGANAAFEKGKGLPKPAKAA